MNVLMVGMTDKLGGTEMFIVNQVKCLNREDIKLFLLNDQMCNSLLFCDMYSKYNVQVMDVSFNANKHPKKFYSELVLNCKNNNINAIIVNVNTMRFRQLLELVAAKKAGAIIRCVHSHTSSCDSIKVWINRLICFFFTHYSISKLINLRLACSDVAGRWEFGHQDFTIIKNGIEINDFRFSETKRNVKRKELALEIDDKVFITVGRICKVKNTDFLVGLFLKYVHSHPHSTLLIVGEKNENSVTYEKIVEKINCAGEYRECIKLLGNRLDIPDLLSASDVFILPSLFEGFGTVVVEAQANGLPCLLSDNVPASTKISSSVEYLSLSSEDVWLRTMHETARNCSLGSRTCVNLDKLNEYDIRNTAGEYWDVIAMQQG